MIRLKHPDKRIEVWFEDETRFGQQGALTRVWAKTGSRLTAVRQTEYAWVYLYGAVNPQTGPSLGLLAPTTHTDLMSGDLAMLGRELAPDVHAILILDQVGWHQAKDLKVPEDMTLYPLPPYSPELNPAERLWWYFRIMTGPTEPTTGTTICLRPPGNSGTD